MIYITDIARKKLLDLFREDNKTIENTFVRVGVQSGGCSGLKYELQLTDSFIETQDKLLDSNGIKIVVEKKSYLYLVGTSLDYSGGLNGKGFQFVNPNAHRTCGCGESFSL